MHDLTSWALKICNIVTICPDKHINWAKWINLDFPPNCYVRWSLLSLAL